MELTGAAAGLHQEGDPAAARARRSSSTRTLGGLRDMHEGARRGLDRRHQEGAHRRRRGPQAGHPGDRGPRHQLRPGRGRLPDPGQRRRDPLGRAADQGRRRRRRRRPDRPLRRAAAAAPTTKPEPGTSRADEPLAEWEQRAARGRRAEGRRPPPAAEPPAAEQPRPSRAAAEPAEPAAPDRTSRRREHMANFTAADVKKLRDLTGAGMMDCKKALDEADGDFDKAVEILRIKGAKDVGKRAGAPPPTAWSPHSGSALLELNCETDFVAKNADFIDAGQTAGRARRRRPSRPTSRRCWPPTLDGKHGRRRSSRSASAKIGEKLVLNRFAVARRHRRGLPAPQEPGPAAAGRRAGRVHRQDRRGRRGGRPRRGDADRRDAAEVPHPRRGARPRSSSPSGASPRRPPARRASRRQALPKIVEGRVNALLQGLRPARAGVGHRQQEDRQAGPRRGRHRGHAGSSASRSARPDATADAREAAVRVRAAASASHRPAAYAGGEARVAHDDGDRRQAVDDRPRRPGRPAGWCSSCPARCSAAARSASTPTWCRPSPARSPTVVRARRAGRRRRRRRQLLPRRRAAEARHGPRPRRLHGHARHGDELPGPAGLPGEGGHRDAGADRDHDGARSPSPTSRCARSGTWRRAAS